MKNTYSSPRLSYETIDCSLPLTMDTYSLCSYRCLYCFAWMERAHNPSIHVEEGVKKVNFERIKKLFEGKDTTKQYAKLYEHIISKKKVMQWGGLTDPFDEYEAKEGESLKLVKFFREINYPIRICTKGAKTLMRPEYQEAFRGAKNFIIMWTIITDDDEKAAKIETLAPAPSERFKAMKFYHDELGIPQIIRIRPFLQGLTDKCWRDLIIKAHDAGAEAISTEWLCIQRMAGVKVRERYEEMSKVLGYDIFEYYRTLSNSQISYMRLNPKIKEKIVYGMKDLCKELGMRFAISDPHFKFLNDTLSCCGLGNNWNFMTSAFNLALKIAKEKGVVSWDDVEKELDWLKDFCGDMIWIARDKKNFRKRKRQNAKDYINTLWNTTSKSGYCPLLYFAGALEPSGTDAKGNIVYKFNAKFADNASKTALHCSLEGR